MTFISHHPSDSALAEYAAGTLDGPRRLVIATHLSLCAQCGAVVDGFEQVGGVLLNTAAPEIMAAGALELALRRINGPSEGSESVQRKTDLPAPLGQYQIGEWRRIGGGVTWRPVSVPVADDIRVFMLRAKGGTQLPRHRHSGIEWTCVLEGAFRHDLGRFGPGDFDEADASMEHSPIIEDGPPCVCLVALKGNIVFQSWLGRLLQPFIRL